MLKKEKPMMTVAAIIEQAQNRWMDQHPLQVYNRFQGSYCKYYFLLVFDFVYISSYFCAFTSQYATHVFNNEKRFSEVDFQFPNIS